MIAASEPLEFVPHGRTVLENHPGKIYSRCNKSSLSENSLLYKLTNFAIKDESLIEGRDEDELEWWCVREVFARRKEDFEDDPPATTKDSKDEYMSESFRPQSRLKNDFNISIKSELAMKKGDADCGSGPSGTSRGGSANSSSNMSKKFSPPSQASPSREKPLSHKTDCCYEEELYVKGCTAVWSKGLTSAPATRLSGPESRETIACFTIEAPIRHAVFCNFHVGINNTMLIDALNSQIGDVKKNIKIEDTTEHLATKNMPSILLVDNKNVRVYATDGREYVTSIPFQVKKVWPMKYGVLFEKEAIPSFQNSMLPASFLKFNESQNSTFSRSKNAFPFNMSARLRQESLSAFDSDVPLPTCFSMSHPLDEVTPILMKSPSQGLQYYNDGDLQIIFVSTNPSIILLYDWKLGTHSLWYVRKAVREECLTMCPNMNSTTTVFSQTCEFPASPMNSVKNVTSWATGAGSPHHSKRGSGTPIMSRSRVNSPMANIFHQQGLSPHASIGHASSVTMMANTCNQAPPSLPLYPEICLDHIWTDTQSIRRDPIENQSDTKSFLHTDLVGHDYLCFMVKVDGSSKLQIVRLQKSHSHGKSSKMNLIVGSITSVSAKDAVVLDHLQMIALIDDSGNIILQSGASVVGKVHVGGVLARLLATAYAAGGLPRRSSLLPSRRDAPLDDSALHLLSPVAPVAAAPAATGLQTLRDAAGTRLTLVFDKSTMYRITLPDIARSSRVIKCCGALRAILPKDVTMQVSNNNK
ncbi:anaphase-promoting complex subunit 1 [Plutella xylostella]|uniref:anaphase-promoting complex subunit 1 n=1 Tax=Plutella xylostella TaxID=51655 RepID=UPI0020327282|nr:anaphase-promoting complex subunit 1 [Plutella xylostella]